MERESTARTTYFCPLLRNVIAEGFCVDVNYVLNDMAAYPDVHVEELLKEARVESKEQAVRTCENCVHYPLERTERPATQTNVSE